MGINTWLENLMIDKLIDLVEEHPVWTLYYCFLTTAMLLFYFITGCLKFG